MTRRIHRLLLLVAVLSLFSSGCISQIHTVGSGPRGGPVHTHSTWYALWGFVPVNELDTRNVVGGAEDYRLRDSFRPVDVIVNIFTVPFTFVRRTTVVEK